MAKPRHGWYGSGATNPSERGEYLSFKGDYQASADVGHETIKVLPRTGMCCLSWYICFIWRSTTSYLL